MNLSSQDEEMPTPINSTYGGHGHMIHHEHSAQNHIIPVNPTNGSIPTTLEENVAYKKVVRYRECLKNHAASMGGNATDGCGEFMPSGLEGTLEALTCSACNCHRNFHRREIEGGPTPPFDFYHHSPHLNRVGSGKKGGLILGHHRGILGTNALGYPTGPPHQMIMSYNMGTLLPSESDEQGGGGGLVARPAHMVKKRFRTKFTQEQKEKMFDFAERAGWKIQKQEESVVQQFCQDIGVKRRVLKVWMHNNKLILAKKNPPDDQIQS